MYSNIRHNYVELIGLKCVHVRLGVKYKETYFKYKYSVSLKLKIQILFLKYLNTNTKVFDPKSGTRMSLNQIECISLCMCVINC